LSFENQKLIVVYPNKYKGKNREVFYNSRTVWILNFEKSQYFFEVPNVV